MKIKRSYLYHNGFINFVSIVGIIQSRKVINDETVLCVYSYANHQMYTISVPFKLSFVKYPVGSHISTISCLVHTKVDGTYLLNLRLKNISLLTIENQNIYDKQLQQFHIEHLLSPKYANNKVYNPDYYMMQISGFVGAINQLPGNKTEILLLQEYNSIATENNNKYIPVVINGTDVLLKLYLGQALFIKGAISAKEGLIIHTLPRLVQHAAISANSQYSHILKIPDWFQIFCQEHNLTKHSDDRLADMMNTYGGRIKIE